MKAPDPVVKLLEGAFLASGLTLDKLNELAKLGHSRQTMSKKVRGIVRWYPGEMVKVERVLGVRVDWHRSQFRLRKVA
jgi:hypothetical protein